MKAERRFRLRHLSGAAIAIALFGSTFLCVSVAAPLAMVWEFLRSVPDEDTPSAVFVGLFASIIFTTFGGAGGLAVFVAIQTWRDDTERKTLQHIHPDQPWFWRHDWVEDSIRHSNRGYATASSLLAACLIALSWGLVALFVNSDFPLERAIELNSIGTASILLVFCAAGFALLVNAGNQWRHHFRWGTSRLELATIPVHPGGPMIGMVELSRPVPDSARVFVSINCYGMRTSRHASNIPKERRESFRAMLFQSQMTFHHDRSTWDTEIPIWIEVPANVPATHHDRQTEWELSVRIEKGWDRFEACFKVPVFRVADETANSKLAVVPEKRSWCNVISKQRDKLESESLGAAVTRFGGRLVREETDALELELPRDPSHWGIKEIGIAFGLLGFLCFGVILSGWVGTVVAFLPVLLMSPTVLRRKLKQRLLLTPHSLTIHQASFWGMRVKEMDTNEIKEIRPWYAENSSMSFLEERLFVRTHSEKLIPILYRLPDRWFGQLIATELNSRLKHNQPPIGEQISTKNPLMSRT